MMQWVYRDYHVHIAIIKSIIIITYKIKAVFNNTVVTISHLINWWNT